MWSTFSEKAMPLKHYYPSFPSFQGEKSILLTPQNTQSNSPTQTPLKQTDTHTHHSDTVSSTHTLRHSDSFTHTHTHTHTDHSQTPPAHTQTHTHAHPETHTQTNTRPLSPPPKHTHLHFVVGGMREYGGGLFSANSMSLQQLYITACENLSHTRTR